MSDACSLTELRLELGHEQRHHRLQGLRSLKFKSDFSFVSAAELSADSELVPALVKCLTRSLDQANSASSGKTGETPGLDREQEEEIVLSLALLEILSKDAEVALSLHRHGMTSVLADLKQCAWYRHHGPATLPTVLHNITTALKASVVVPAWQSTADDDLQQPFRSGELDPQACAVGAVPTTRATGHQANTATGLLLLELVHKLAGDDTSAVRQACHTLRLLGSRVPALAILQSSGVLQVLLQRLSVHDSAGKCLLPAADLYPQLLMTCTCLVNNLKSHLLFHCHPHTSSAGSWIFDQQSRDTFTDLSLDTVLSIFSALLPMALVTHTVMPLVASTLTAGVQLLCSVKTKLLSNTGFPRSKAKDVTNTLELLCRCLHHLLKEVSASDGDGCGEAMACESSLRSFHTVLACSLNNLLSLMQPTQLVLSRTAQSTVDQLVLDPVLNIAHPNVVANLMLHATESVAKVWRDMRKYAHSVAAVRAFAGMTTDELQVDIAMSLRLACLCMPCLAFLDKDACSDIVTNLCRFLAPRVMRDVSACHTVLGLLTHTSAAVRQFAYAALVKLWRDQLLTLKASLASMDDQATNTLFLLQPDILRQISLFGLYDHVPQVVRSSSSLVSAMLHCAPLCCDLGVAAAAWSNCCQLCLPYIQAFAGNDAKIDTRLMQLLSPAKANAPAGETSESACQTVCELPLSCRLRGLYRWLFARDVRLRLWALTHLAKLMVEEDDPSLLTPLDRAPNVAVADLFLVPCPISSAQPGHSIPVTRATELVEIMKNARLGVSLRLAAAHQLLSAVKGMTVRLPTDLVIADMMSVLRQCMTRACAEKRVGSGQQSDCENLLPLLEPCVGILAVSLEQPSDCRIRQAHANNMPLCWAVFRACLLVPGNKMLRSYASRLLLCLVFGECSSDQDQPGVKFASSTALREAAEAPCYWQHILERFQIKATITSSCVESSHSQPALVLSDSRPDMYSVLDLQVLCNQWTTLTALRTADTREDCDALLCGLVDVLNSMPDSTIRSLAALHLSTALSSSVDDLRSALNHTMVLAALHRMQSIMSAVSAVEDCSACVARSSLFPRCISPCNVASVDGGAILRVVNRFLSVQPANADDMSMFLELVSTLQQIVAGAKMMNFSELVLGLAQSVSSPQSVFMAVLHRHLSTYLSQSDKRSECINAVSVLLKFYSTLLQELPSDQVSRYAWSALPSLSFALDTIVKHSLAKSTSDASSVLLCRVLEWLLHVSAKLNFDESTSGAVHWDGNTYHTVGCLLQNLVQIVAHRSCQSADGELSTLSSTCIVAPAMLSLSQLSGFLDTQSAMKNWRHHFFLAAGLEASAATNCSGLEWMKPVLHSSDPVVRWSSLRCLAVLICDQCTLAHALTLCSDHADNLWGLAMDSIRDEELCALVRKQACLLLVRLTSRWSLDLLTQVCQQTSQPQKLQKMCTVPGLVAWLVSRKIRFYGWLHDMLSRVVQALQGAGSGSGADTDGGFDLGRHSWLSSLCPLVHNLIALSAGPVVDMLSSSSVFTVLISIITEPGVDINFQLPCCQLLCAATSASEALRSWLVSSDCPLRQLIQCFGSGTSMPVTSMVASIVRQLLDAPPSTFPTATAATDLVCESWEMCAGWCRRMLSSGDEQTSLTALSLLSSLLGHAHAQVQKSGGTAVPTVLACLEPEQFANGCDQSIVTEESSSGTLGSMSSHVCSCCLSTFLMGLCRPDDLFKQSFLSDGAHTLLVAMLALSAVTRKQALAIGFCEAVSARLLSCDQQLKVMALKVNISAAERKTLERSVLSDCVRALQLLQNVAFHSDDAKPCLADSGVAHLLHRLWCYALLHEDVMHAVLAFLITYTARCAQACQSVLLSSLPLDRSHSSTTPSLHTKSLVHFMAHRVQHLLSLSMRVSSAPGRNTSSRVTGNELSLLMLCAALASLCRVTSCRRVLVKEGLLSRFAPSGNLPLKNAVLVHCLLQLCLAMSFSQDGIAHLLKLPGMVDWLCDVGSSASAARFSLPASFGYRTSSGESLTAQNLVLSSAIALRNVGVEHKRLLHTTDRPKELFHRLLRAGTEVEKRVATEALAVSKVGAL